MVQEVKLIFSPQVAKHLIKRNFQIIDIKPNKHDKDKTVFVFRKDDGLIKAIQDYKNET